MNYVEIAFVLSLLTMSVFVITRQGMIFEFVRGWVAASPPQPPSAACFGDVVAANAAYPSRSAPCPPWP